MKLLLRPIRLGYLWLVVGILTWNSCQRDETVIPDQPSPTAYTAAVPLAYHELFLNLERFTPGYRPPVSARASAYVSWIGYEAIVAGTSGYQSLVDYYNVPNVPTADPDLEYHWPTVLTEAYTTALEYFFPTAPAEHLFSIYQTRTDFFLDFKQDLPQEVFSRSSAFGRELATAICAWSATDEAGHEAYLRNSDPTYQPPGGPGRWQPTYPDFSQALLPRWGDVRTFAADESDIVADPLPYDETPGTELYLQAEEVMEKVNEIKTGGLEEDFWIAQFWSDDCPILTFTPSGRWYAVANQLVVRHNMRMDEAVALYARMGMALNDAGVRAWHEKYRFNYLRPIDYIRAVMPDQQAWNTVMCPDGSGNYFTPNFPAYPSGHATFSAAAIKVLEAYFGANTGMIDRCHEGRSEFNGAPRQFQTFRQMAEENAYSRIPLGVHFQMDSDEGLLLGYGIGDKINQLPWER
ncbi:MAG: vanadium-dependent haloperoxidase [Saprospiraceae bacterium]